MAGSLSAPDVNARVCYSTSMDHVFGVSASVLGQPWRWRSPHLSDAGQGQGSAVDFTARLLLSRGAASAELDRHRQPRVRDWLPDPSIFSDMDVAAERLARAVQAGERVTIFGDYDVDGATSVALLVRFLRMLGVGASHYIPDRLLEGYGPNPEALRQIAAAGSTLVVTVDCGTHGFEAFEAASSLGLDVIVVDHHKPGTTLPPVLAVVNPNRFDETPEGARHGHLAAVGLAFVLAVAVTRVLRRSGWFDGRPEPDLLELLDLVALGTVADVAPLTGLNRAFVAQGLKVMARRGNLGLAALIDVRALDRAPQAGDLGFALGPCINAGGRVGCASHGASLLITEDGSEAAALASELNRMNGERRAIEQQVTAEALAAAGAVRDDPVAVVAAHGWHPGVVGIVASRLKDALGRPAIVIGIGDDGLGKGSGRSIAGVDLGAAVLAARDSGLLVKGGGHAMAAGVTVVPSQIDRLRTFLCERLGADVERARRDQALYLDAALAPGGVCVALAEELERAGPYGAGWPAPRVAAGPFRVVKSSVVGDAHVRAILSGADGTRLKSIAFRHGDSAVGAALTAPGGRRIFVAGRVVRDDWGAQPCAELHVDDVAWAD
jgi:single-stranded-DNA-specific exonuclease